MATKDGRIVLENTLDARLEVVFKQQLPEVSLDSTTSVGIYLECLPVSYKCEIVRMCDASWHNSRNLINGGNSGVWLVPLSENHFSGRQG